MRRSFRWFPVSVVLLLAAGQAEAQDVATGATLFQKGVSDMAAGKFDTGCPAVAESYRLDPRPGTLFTLAECYGKAGKVASAVARYQDYLNLFSRMTPDQQGKQQGREKTSQEQKDRLSPDVPTLTLKLPPNTPADTEVKRDGILLGGPSLGLALPVDPGDHTITTQEPGGPLATETVTIGKGEKKEVTLTVKSPSSATAGGSPSSGGSSSTPDSSGGGSSQRTAGLAIAGVGVVGLVIGGITGGITLGKKSTITSNCSLDTKICTSTAGTDAASSAKTTGLVSTVGFIVGGAALVGGLTLVLTAPKKSAPAVTVGMGPGGPALRLSGAF